jgi:hypothetical protein
MSEDARARAAESVSAHFTRVMNATTSRWGMLTDPSIVGVATAPVVVALLAAIRLEAAPALITALQALAATPLLVAVAVTLAQRSARGGVVAWLAGLPFPLENMNAVLNGLGESLEVTFHTAAPGVQQLNAALEQVSPDCFVSKSPEDKGRPLGQPPEEAGQAAGGYRGGPTDPGPATVELRIGVVDDKRNPSASNHQRFARVKALVAEVLIPLMEKHPIAEVRVK